MLVALIVDYKGQRIKIYAAEILRLINKCLKEKYGIKFKKINNSLRGEGTFDSPYRLDDEKDWLSALKFLSHKMDNHLTLFNIHDQLISCQHHNKYITHWGSSRANCSRPIRRAIFNRYSQGGLPQIPRITSLRIILFFLVLATVIGPFQPLAAISLVVLGLVMATVLRNHGEPLLFNTTGMLLDINPSYPHLQNMHANLNINDSKLSKNVRALRFRKNRVEHDEELINKSYTILLASTLYLGEAVRNPATLLSTSIICDFIQQRTLYGRGNVKRYNWNNALWDTEGAPVYNAHFELKEPHEWGGKFPMAHEGSYSELQVNRINKSLDFEYPSVTSKQKEISLFIRWISIFLKQKYNYNSTVVVMKPLAALPGTQPCYRHKEDKHDIWDHISELKSNGNTKKFNRLESKQKDGRIRADEQRELNEFNYIYAKAEIFKLIEKAIFDRLNGSQCMINSDSRVTNFRMGF